MFTKHYTNLKQLLQLSKYCPRVILFILISISVCIQLHNKSDHFQEVDSFITFIDFSTFPAKALKLYEDFYPNKNAIVNKVRLPIINGVAALHLPKQLEIFFSLPLCETYSPIPGLLYGLVYTTGEGWYSFLSKAILVNMVFFHIAVILLFLVFKNIGCSNSAALFGVTILLCSYSLHHYTYHLGSTLWMFCSTAAWLYFYTKNHAKIHTISGILLLFNYTIAILWGAMVLHQLLTVKNKRKVLIATLPFLGFAFFVGLLLYPPSNSLRGSYNGIQSLPIRFYYLILNALSPHTVGSIILEVGVFLVLFSLLIYGIVTSYKTPIMKYIRYFTVVLFFFFAFNKLIFSPERQLIFLAPLIIIPIILGLHRFLKYIKNWQAYVMLLVLAICGFYSVVLSNGKASKTIAYEQVVHKKNLIYDSITGFEFDILFGVKTLDYKTLKKDSLYTYIGREYNFKGYLNAHNITGYEVIKDTAIINDVSFKYNHPKKSKYCIPNNFYQTIFKKIN